MEAFAKLGSVAKTAGDRGRRTRVVSQGLGFQRAGPLRVTPEPPAMFTSSALMGDALFAKGAFGFSRTFSLPDGEFLRDTGRRLGR